MCINHTVVRVLKRLHKTNSLACHWLLAQALARPVSKVGWDANQLQDNVDGVFKVQVNSSRPRGYLSSLSVIAFHDVIGISNHQNLKNMLLSEF